MHDDIIREALDSGLHGIHLGVELGFGGGLMEGRGGYLQREGG